MAIGKKAAESVLDLARPALLLEPHDTAESWIGGSPVLDAGGTWPTADGEPLPHLATLDLADLRRAWRGLPISGKGRLSFFFGPVHRDGWLDDQCAVVASGPRASSSDPPEDLGVRFARVPVRSRLILTLPVDAEELLGSETASSAHAVLDEVFGASGARHQVGGHASWIQEPEAGELVLQIDSDSEAGMRWGDGGAVYFVSDASPVTTSDLASVRASMQCY